MTTTATTASSSVGAATAAAAAAAVSPAEEQQQRERRQRSRREDDGGRDAGAADGGDEWLVSCRCESAKAVSTLLCCLRHVGSGDGGGNGARDSSSLSQRNGGGGRSGKKQSGAMSSSSSPPALQPVTVFCSPSGLTFHAHGKAKQAQASVDLHAGMFAQYRVAEQVQVVGGVNGGSGEGGGEEGEESKPDWHAGGEFCVNLTTLLECLHVLGLQNLEKTKLCLSYNLTKEVLKLELLQEESGVLSTAAIPGIVPADDDDLQNSLALAFRSSIIAARMIVKSETLLHVVQELELVSGATVGTVSLGPKGLDMSVTGHFGECMVSVPAKGGHVVSLELPTGAQSVRTHRYPLHSLLAAMRGLEIAQETCVTMNSQGMMAIQHQVLPDANATGDGNPNYVDFIMCCLEDDDEEEGDEEGEEDATVSSPLGQRSGLSQVTVGEEEETEPRSVPGESPTQPRRRRANTRPSPPVHYNRGRESDSDSDSDSDADEDRDSRARQQSSAALFGSLAGTSPSQGSSMGAGSFRSTRRRTTSRRRRHFDNGGSVVADDGDRSTNPVARDSDAGDEHEEEEEEEETQPLDVTESATPIRRHRDDECSSPELVYGRQH